MTPDELQKQRAEEAAAREQAKKDEVLNQQKQQLQQVLGEVIAPIQTALVDLQGKFQGLQEQQIRAESKPGKTPVEEMDEMLNELSTDDKYDKLSNKQMLDVISASLDTALKANAQVVRESIVEDMKPTLEKVGTLEKTTLQLIAGIGVKEARSKHKDFDEHLPEIKAVLTRYPGMEYDDAYLLAKSQKAGALPPKGQIDTEKPQSTGVTSNINADPTHMTVDNMQAMAQRGKDARSGMQLHGKAGFMAIAEVAADKVLAAHD